MSRLAIIAAALLGAAAVPSTLSQHPREGRLCEIHFEHGSAILPVGIESHLDEVAGWTVEHPSGLVVLDTHSDADSPNDHTLAIHRADAIRDALATAHVDTDRFVIAVYGPRPDPSSVVVWGTDEDEQTVAAFVVPPIVAALP
jgi:hypothetical protein